MTLNGLVTLDASGTAGAFVAFTNTNAAVVNNPGTATALALTLTGSNTDNNVLGASLSNYNASGTGAAAVLSISKTGNSVWALTGNSSFTGNVVVAGGILKPRSNGALGTGNQVQINDNTANATPASVVLDNPAGVTIANNFRTTGSGAGNANPDGVGVIRSMAGSNVLSGVLTLSSGGGFSTYTVDAGSTLTLSGTVTNDTARTLDMGGAGVGNISGVISNGVGAQSLEKRGTGTWIVSGTNNTFTGSTVVGVGTLQVTGSIATSSGVTASGGKFDAASAQMVKTLTVNTGGTAVVSGALKALTVGDNSSAAPLTIANGKLDLAGNGLIVDVAPGNEATALASVRASILSGFNASSPAAGDGTWNGNGIISSTAAANTSSKGVGYALSTDILPSGGTFLGSTVDTSAVLARYTLLGDATLDGTVDFNDLVQLAQNYNVTDGTRTWFTGDFTYDGNVDFNDLVKLAQNYNSALPAAGIPGAPASFAADWALAVSAVPEPTSLGLVGVAAAGLLRRRRRAR